MFGGFGYLFRTPDVWPLALVPVGIALVLAAVLGTLSVTKVAPLLVSLIVKEPASGVLAKMVHGLLDVLAVVLSLVVALAISFALAKPLAGPALEKMVRRIESDLGAPPWPPPSLFDDVWRSLQSTLVAFVFTAPILALLGLVGLLVPPASVVTFPLQLVVTALAGAWDFCDYPLSIRGVSVARRVAFVWRNIGAVMGFGLGLALLSLVPCALLLAVPACALGAARLVVELERWEGPADRIR